MTEILNAKDIENVSGGAGSNSGYIGFTCPKCTAKFAIAKSKFTTDPIKYQHSCGAKLTLYTSGIASGDALDAAVGCIK